jgi:acyl-CoA synthetase (NDP forming)
MLAPRSIAVIGGAPAMRVVEQCRKLGYTGDIWPVHPTRSEMHAVPCFASISDLPGAPDVAFIGVNRHLTVDAVRSLSALGAGGAVCYASGFAENGEVALQQQLVEAAADMPLIGPNCYGYVNALDGVALWPDEHGCAPLGRGVGIVAQSGNVGLNLTLAQRGLPLAYLVTVGNQAASGTEDVIEHFIADDRVTAIGMFIEAIREPRRFAELANLAFAKGKRIVALQTGRSEAGALIAASHTASLAGNRQAYAAFFDRCGVAQVDTPTELLETLKLLHHGGALSGYRMASLSCSGGEASLVADLSETTGLRFEPFPDEQKSRIETTLTELVNVANPFDYHTFMWGDRAAMARTFSETIIGPHDATMLVLDAPNAPDLDPSTWAVAAEAFADAVDATGKRGVVVATIPECLSAELRALISSRGLAPLQGLREALIALDRCAWLGDHVPLAAPAVAHGAPSTRLVDEADAKAMLAEHGIRVPVGRRCSRTDAEQVAQAIGYPVTLKGLGIAHKSESDAVHVGIDDAADLARALDRLPARVDQVLLEETVTNVVAEVLVSIRRVAPIGWMIVVGAGGVQTEILRDTSALLAPATREEVSVALSSLRIAPLFAGFRGKPGIEMDKLLDLIMRLQEVVVGGTVVEIELNPVLATRHDAVAVDALLIEEGD